MSASQREGQSGFWPGVFLGGLAGMALGVLLAPRPGSATREQLLEQAGNALLGQGVGEQASSLRETFEEVREILREAVIEGREVLREAITEGRHASARTEDEMRHRYEQATGQEP